MMKVSTFKYLQRATVAILSLFVSVGASGVFLGTTSANAQTATATAAAKDARVDVFIALDNSTKTPGAQWLESQRAALTFIESLPSTARIGVISFGNFPQMTQTLSNDRGGARRAISTMIQEDGESQLASAINLAAQSYDDSSTAGRILLAVTDGREGTSAQRIEASDNDAITHRVTVAVIDPSNGLSPNQGTVRQVGKGGVVLSKDPKSISELGTKLVSFATSAAPNQSALTAPTTPEVGIVTRITSNTFVLLLGALMMGGAIFFGAMQVLGPKQAKVNLTGIIEKPKTVKDVKTPLAGIGSRLTEIADKQLENRGKSSSMQEWLERAAINLRSGEFLVLAVVASLSLALMGGLLIGKLWAPLGLLAGAFGARFIVNFKANKRSKKFGEQLSDTLQLLSSSMRAGQGFMQALDAVSKEADAPTAEEFRRVVVETRLGRDLLDSMKALSERIRCVDLEWVIPAVEINRDVGGDLAEVLEQVGTTIRDRADLRRQVKTLSAEGRLSAIVLIGLPIALGLFINLSNPEYMSVLFHDIGLYFVGAAAVLMLVGSIWLFNICKIEF
jgi:tight adherence protein B